MLVKKAIVLAAGKGTRMGDLGKKLAKPMWPFFGLTFLELQLLFLEEQFGIETIYLNSHHLYKQLESLNSQKVKIIYEPVLLDQGGGILNINKKFKLWDEPLLINNADQFYFFDKKEFRKSVEENKNTLFGLKVNKEDGYNKLDISNDGKLKKIIKNSDVKDSCFSTYSGLALLTTKKQDYNNNPISFFESVANFKADSISVKEITSGEYYDFGKLSEYYELCFSTKECLDNGRTNSLIDLMKSSNQFQYMKGEGLNFSNDKNVIAKKGEIILDQGKIFKKDGVLKSS